MHVNDMCVLITPLDYPNAQFSVPIRKFNIQKKGKKKKTKSDY